MFSIASGIPILSGELREVAGSPRWVLVTASALVLLMLLGLALIGLYLAQERRLARGPSIALLVGALLAILPAPTAIRTLVLTVAVAVLATRRR